MTRINSPENVGTRETWSHHGKQDQEFRYAYATSFILFASALWAYPKGMTAIDQWHAFVQTRDPALLHALLAPDAVFESPVVHTPQIGRATTEKYLLGAIQVLGTEAFRYTGEWRNGTGALLEFETEIDGIKVNGVDIIRLSNDGERIAHFKVMIRPLKAIEVVHRKMGEMLARG